ncbi:metal-dependent hydrolase [Streptomyces triticagri]|uniref:Metal-dependent hydrolase n=1 Tax=Streptomyces triticagri TaxID=2293568 RepID=A0A372M9T0_9ACTN|nr:endonuclease/exonuclease/phosphatase family protein [Streptomyces triticagri]RFU87360.1 metal-dependent hydrolase [Streptomyces triticagri]
MALRRGTWQLLLVGGLLSGLAVAPAAADEGSSAGAARGGGHHAPLRVASYNMHAGAGADEVFDLDRQVAELRALDADVIGLQEVDVHWDQRSEWRDLAGELAEALDMHVYFAPIYSLDPPAAGEPRREYGVAVLSRHRIVAATNHEITRLSTQDPDPVPAPAPGFGEVVLRVRGVPVHIYVTHLDYRPDPSVRIAQVADTRRIMAEDCSARGRCPAQVLLGDFNAEPDAGEFGPLWKDLRDVDPGGPTYPALEPVKRIDYVAVNGPVRGGAAAVVGDGASDHLGVIADLRLRRR